MGLAVALIPRQHVIAHLADTSSAFETRPVACQARCAATGTVAPHSRDSDFSSRGHTLRPSDERLMMQVMLDDVFLAPFRRALFSASEGLITLLRVQTDPRDSRRVKVWLGMNRPAVRAVIELIVATLPEAEIGRIAPA